MKKYRIIAGASAAVLALGLLTACGARQEEVVEKEPVVQEENLEAVTPEEEPIVEFPLEDGEAEEAPAEETEAELPAESQRILVAELTEIAEDGAMTIQPYGQIGEGAEIIIEDAANVDFSAFEAGEETEALILAEDAVFQLAQDGELTDADQTALIVGSMLVITTDESGLQTVVIYQAQEA